MSGRKALSPERSGPVEAIVVPVERIEPNPWNPNTMNEAMYEKELASIRKFGFVDPLTVREVGVDRYQIIDGEHRWRGAADLGYTELPCWNLGIIEDDDAKQLTIVLNETRGQSDQARLGVLLSELAARRGEPEIREIMPFDRARFDELVGKASIDWEALEKRREAVKGEGRWKELVYRMPYDAAKVVEDAVAAVQEREGFSDSWRALEMICADSLA